MSDLDDLRARVASLETILSGVDRDQSDNASAIKATHHLVQALSITQSQHTQWLEELRAGQQLIVDMLTRLIERDEQG